MEFWPRHCPFVVLRTRGFLSSSSRVGRGQAFASILYVHANSMSMQSKRRRVRLSIIHYIRPGPLKPILLTTPQSRIALLTLPELVNPLKACVSMWESEKRDEPRLLPSNRREERKKRGSKRMGTRRRRDDTLRDVRTSVEPAHVSRTLDTQCFRLPGRLKNQFSKIPSQKKQLR